MTMRLPVLVAGLIGLGALPGAAQVGHAPDRSPYHDLRQKQTLTFFGGRLSGGRGKARIGPSSGFLAGARFDLRVGSGTLFLGVSTIDAERRLVEPDDPPETRFFGTASQQLTVIDGGGTLILTGRKTWHGWAPYFGGAIGAVTGSTVPEDSSGFSFRSKFQFGPLVGLRYYPGGRLHFRAEVRDIIWRLNYGGTRLFDVPASDPLAPPVLDPLTTRRNEFVHHLTLTFGIGWAIRL